MVYIGTAPPVSRPGMLAKIPSAPHEKALAQPFSLIDYIETLISGRHVRPKSFGTPRVEAFRWALTISRSTFYNYFDDKADLLSALTPRSASTTARWTPVRCPRETAGWLTCRSERSLTNIAATATDEEAAALTVPRGR